MNALIYVIEDDENIRDLVSFALKNNNYNVKSFETAEEALENIANDKPNLAVFDLMLPNMSGLDAIKILRKNPEFTSLPMIVLTAKGSEIDKVTGLDAGADDYITKPFGILELCARIRSLLRRSDTGSNEDNEKLQFGELEIDFNTREVFIGGNEKQLTYKEFELLKHLIKNKDRVVPREELLNEIWGYEYTGETRTIDIHIGTLRCKLENMGNLIKTVRSIGYRFSPKELVNE